MMPRQCLKKERDNWFLLRWIEKRKQWKFNQIHPLVAELVKEQQKFLDINLGSNFDFDRLFCKVSTAHSHGAKGCGTRFQREPAYLPKILVILCQPQYNRISFFEAHALLVLIQKLVLIDYFQVEIFHT